MNPKLNTNRLFKLCDFLLGLCEKMTEELAVSYDCMDEELVKQFRLIASITCKFIKTARAVQKGDLEYERFHGINSDFINNKGNWDFLSLNKENKIKMMKEYVKRWEDLSKSKSTKDSKDNKEKDNKESKDRSNKGSNSSKAKPEWAVPVMEDGNWGANLRSRISSLSRNQDDSDEMASCMKSIYPKMWIKNGGDSGASNGVNALM